MEFVIVDDEAESTVDLSKERVQLSVAICTELQLAAMKKQSKQELEEPFCLITTSMQLMSLPTDELKSIAKACGI